MKRRIAVSAGLVALGVTAIQASPVNGLNSMQTSKMWSVAATLRGFYDDNYNLSSGGPTKRDSYGLEIRPSAGINVSFEQTLLSASYTFSARWFEDRDSGNLPAGISNDPWDYSHQFDLSLVHSFSERYMVELRDSFVVSQEPQIIDPNLSAVTRADGDNIRNTASIKFNIELTRLLNLVLGYHNTFYDYNDDNGTVATGGSPSRSGLLDRMEHRANVDLRWQVARNTTGVVGYEFGAVNYTQNEQVTAGGAFSTDHNNYSHYVYLGADHNFNEQFSGMVRVGGQYTDYYNSLPGSESDTFSPRADARLSYNYAPSSSASLGFQHSRNQTDVATSQDQETSRVYVNVVHQITAKLTGNIYGYAQWATFNGGSADPNDGNTDTFYGVDLNLNYDFNQHFSAEAGYKYDTLNSDIVGRDYDRNQFYIGFTAAY